LSASARPDWCPRQKIRKISSKIEVTPPDAKAALSLWFTFDKDSFWAQAYKPTALIAVDLYFRKQPNKTWLLSRSEVREVDKTPLNWGMTKAPLAEPGVSGQLADIGLWSPSAARPAS
jgi:hypothetical protein